MCVHTYNTPHMYVVHQYISTYILTSALFTIRSGHTNGVSEWAMDISFDNFDMLDSLHSTLLFTFDYFLR